MDMIERIKMEAKGYSTYDVRREEYQSEKSDGINFRVSPTPFKLNKNQKKRNRRYWKSNM